MRPRRPAPRKVLFVTKARGDGGSEKHTRDLLARLDPAEVAPFVWCYGFDAYTSHLRERPEVCVRTHERPSESSILSFWSSLVRLAPEVVVFVNGWLGQFHWGTYLAARLSGARRVIAIEHSTPYAWPVEAPAGGRRPSALNLAAAIARSLRRLVTTRLPGLVCHRTICVSDSVRERLIRDYQYPSSRTITIRNGVDLRWYGPAEEARERVRADLGFGREDPVVVCVTRFERLKRTDLLLRGLAIVRRQHSSCRCVLVGSGPLEAELRSMTRDLDLAESVRFVGQAADVRPYLAAGDLFVLPSEKEGLPLVLLEAMACALPCVAADVGGNKEAIRHQESGLIVAPGSVAELADAMKFLIAHEEERLRMASNARSVVAREFDIEDTMARIRAVMFGGEQGSPAALRTARRERECREGRAARTVR